MTTKRLNGWQRLFVLIAILYAFAVGAIAVIDMPGDERIYHNWVDSLLRIVKRNENMEIDTDVLKYRWYSGLSDKDIVQRINANTKKMDAFYKNQVAKMGEIYSKQLEGLPREQWIHIGLSFSFWIIPLIALYAFGYGVGWVYRGFKQ